MSVTVDQLRSLLTDPGKLYAGTNKVGNIGQVYVDDVTGDPTWVTVKTGLFGTAESFAPLDGARIDGNDIVVAVEEHAIKDSPRVDPDGSLTPEEEESLYRHYGLYGYGADEVGTGDLTTTTDAPGAVGRDTSGPTTDQAMTRSEEHLRIRTREHEIGRARLRKFVVSENVQQTVPLRHQELTIERQPISDAAAADLGQVGISEDEVVIVLHGEVPVVDKEVVAAERIRLGTRTVTENTTVADTLRHEEIVLEDGTTTSSGPTGSELTSGDDRSGRTR